MPNNKTASKKVTIIKKDPPKQRPYDLETGRDTQRIALVFQDFQTTEGWLLMSEIIKKNIAVLEMQIIDKTDLVTGKPIPEEVIDGLRDKRAIYKEILELPNKSVQKVDENLYPEMPNDDPYDTVETVKERLRK